MGQEQPHRQLPRQLPLSQAEQLSFAHIDFHTAYETLNAAKREYSNRAHSSILESLVSGERKQSPDELAALEKLRAAARDLAQCRSALERLEADEDAAAH